MTDVEAVAREYRIDDLARAAGSTVRNVRAYQDRGLLPAPRRRGRVGWYSETHLTRLRLITKLLERGFTLAHIAELLELQESGGDLREFLGIELDPADGPMTLSATDLAAMFPSGLSDEFVRKAVELHLVQIDGAEVRVPHRGLFNAGIELHRAGVPLEELIDQLGRVQSDVDQMAARFVSLVLTYVVGPRLATGLPAGEAVPGVVDVVRRIRPLAELVVDTELALALDRHARAELAKYLGRIVDRFDVDRAG